MQRKWQVHSIIAEAQTQAQSSACWWRDSSLLSNRGDGGFSPDVQSGLRCVRCAVRSQVGARVPGRALLGDSWVRDSGWGKAAMQAGARGLVHPSLRLWAGAGQTGVEAAGSALGDTRGV